MQTLGSTQMLHLTVLSSLVACFLKSLIAQACDDAYIIMFYTSHYCYNEEEVSSKTCVQQASDRPQR